MRIALLGAGLLVGVGVAAAPSAPALGQQARPVPDLKTLATSQRVTAVTHCRGQYDVALADGSVRVFKEYDLSFKTDSGPNGPSPAAPAFVPTGRIGDRALVVLAETGELRRLVRGCTDRVRLLAAGSLRGAVGDVAAAFTRAYGVGVDLEFGASGTLRDRLDAGERGDVFASANMEHPLTLARRGKAGPVVLFARNELCALAQPGLTVTSGDLLERLLDPAVKVGTSTPSADPSGDYAWEVFRKAERIRPGSRALLERKALMLTGAPTSPRPPEGQSAYAWLMRERRADIFLTYCTNARFAAREVAGLQVIPLPSGLSVGADYGLTVLGAADPEWGPKLVLFILSPDGQAILARHGFAAPMRVE